MNVDYITLLRATYLFMYIFFCTHECVPVYNVTCMRELQYISTHSKTRQTTWVRSYLQEPAALPQGGPQRHSGPIGKDNNLQRIEPRSSIIHSLYG